MKKIKDLYNALSDEDKKLIVVFTIEISILIIICIGIICVNSAL